MNALDVTPQVAYPKIAQIGKTYLMTIDFLSEGVWKFKEEEYPIYLMVRSTSLFPSIKCVGEPCVLVHRFGGSYGAAKFLLTAGSSPMQGNLIISLVNQGGVPLEPLTLPNIEVIP